MDTGSSVNAGMSAEQMPVHAMQGAPFNIKDFKVLLDAQVYEDLEGRWVDLFNRMKWDIIKSVLKSVAGLQGRKFKVCLPAELFCIWCSGGFLADCFQQEIGRKLGNCSQLPFKKLISS